LKGIAVSLLLLLGILQPLHADHLFTDSSALARLLEKQGFTSVHATNSFDNKLTISYENRAFRNEVLAAGVVLAAVNQFVSDSCCVVLIPHRNGVAMGSVATDISTYRSFITGQIEQSIFVKNLDFDDKGDLAALADGTLKRKRNFPLADLLINPSITMQLGNYDDAVKATLGLAPELNVDVWRGATLAARVLFPMYDELGIYTLDPRLLRLSLFQAFRLSSDDLFFAQIGVFEPDRWGIAGEWAHFLYGRRFLLGCKGQYTGFFLHQEGTINYSPWRTGTGQVYANYFAPRYDLTVRLAYTKYLFSENGPSIQVSRKFADLEIGLLAAKTNIDEFGGIVLKVPLSPQKSGNPQKLRMRLPEYHTWKYESASLAHTQGQTVQTGVMVTSAMEAMDWLHFFIPTFIKNNIALWKTANLYLEMQKTD